MNELHAAILGQFQLDARAVSCDRYGCGHINETHLVVTASGHRYILQKINHHVFRDVAGLMENVTAVTDYLRGQTSDPRAVMRLVKTVDNAAYLEYEGSFWRVYDFVEDSICLQQAETPEDFYESAVAFGSFQQQLKDFPAATLHETIPNFHNTADRYRIFKEAVAADKAGRVKDVQAEIDFALAREAEAGTLVRLLAEGKLPLRVTHNDTKLNNVMLDAKTRKALCVIDLDTVMPGLSLYDFGDSIRFGAASAEEDEQDLSKVEMRLDLFTTYTKGFLGACPGLTDLERELLPLGAKLMTLECGVRFLTDYLDGDHYFATHRPGQNLDRCRTQFKLVADMEAKWQQKLTIFGDDYPTPDGTCQRDYLHVVDLAVGHLRALEYAENHEGVEAINLGTGNGISVLELVHAFESANEMKLPYVIGPRRSGDLPAFWADAEKAKTLLGWEATHTVEDMCRSAWNFAKQSAKQ